MSKEGIRDWRKESNEKMKNQFLKKARVVMDTISVMQGLVRELKEVQDDLQEARIKLSSAFTGINLTLEEVREEYGLDSITGLGDDFVRAWELSLNSAREHVWIHKVLFSDDVKELSISNGAVKSTKILGIDIRKYKTYLMRNNRNGYIKIGRSVKPQFREKTLQSEEPDIELLAVTDRDCEKQLHKKYKDKRVRGEWFDLSEDDIKYLTESILLSGMGFKLIKE